MHDYANLYFNPRNAMLSYLINVPKITDEICVLVISGNVLKIPDTIITDMNAAASFAKFLPASALASLNFDDIYIKNWNHRDENIKKILKKKTCAEVLVPHQIPSEAILGAYVGSDAAEKALIAIGFDPKKVKPNPRIFFRQ